MTQTQTHSRDSGTPFPVAMRLSLYFFALVGAVLLFSAAPAQADSPLQRVADATAALSAPLSLEEVEASFADLESLGVSGRCLAKCAVKVTACVALCGKKNAFAEDDGLQLTCRQTCAAKAAGCAAVCALLPVATEPEAAAPVTEESELIITGDNVDAAFAALEPEAEIDVLGGKGKCLAKCGVTSAACLVTCGKKLTSFEEEAEDSLQMGCRAKCLVNAASCAALCVIGSEQQQALDGSAPSELPPVQPAVSLLLDAAGVMDAEVSPADQADALALQSLNRAYPLYLQCDAKWGKRQLGTGPNTICSAGCAMTSLTMALASYGVKLAGATVNPASLNDYLKATGGYVNKQLLVWSGADKLGGPKFRNYWRGKGSMSVASLNAVTKAGKPVIVNTKNGGHWVLVTGPSSNGRTFPTNDPGANRKTHEYSEFVNFIEYA